ncbi:MULTISPECIES: hypothetical protein [Cyanophyceae]|uniref:hypothetical protein n=1 Tax=Cyanophyceae TaxID=3028117 RepID=UPI001687FB7A|nr:MULTISPECIES: hypothetical protein [Cyanophyceae]MBD1917543.1 hypothetical protein [Phormidium sp. FACHB-77]MBD2029582.1 hypothetical protein [Phormidium sp. FACHB-322]MBD2050843.1 hypothetical protein [Leptolyngbya sp. FACHB-60]
MARKKRSSVALEKAQRRIAGMQSVTRAADFGNGYTMEAYDAHIQTMQEKLMAYNRMLSMVDGAYNDMLMAERKLMDFSDHMLSGFGVRYGKDSSEYEMAGGRRKSDRQKRTRRTANTVNVA